jgi:hypothetical protein
MESGWDRPDCILPRCPGTGVAGPSRAAAGAGGAPSGDEGGGAVVFFSRTTHELVCKVSSAQAMQGTRSMCSGRPCCRPPPFCRWACPHRSRRWPGTTASTRSLQASVSCGAAARALAECAVAVAALATSSTCRLPPPPRAPRQPQGRRDAGAVRPHAQRARRGGRCQPPAAHAQPPGLQPADAHQDAARAAHVPVRCARHRAAKDRGPNTPCDFRGTHSCRVCLAGRTQSRSARLKRRRSALGGPTWAPWRAAGGAGGWAPRGARCSRSTCSSRQAGAAGVHDGARLRQLWRRALQPEPS